MYRGKGAKARTDENRAFEANRGSGTEAAGKNDNGGGEMTNQEWIADMTKEQLASLLTRMNLRKLDRRAREVWLEAEHTKEDEKILYEERKKK